LRNILISTMTGAYFGRPVVRPATMRVSAAASAPTAAATLPPLGGGSDAPPTVWSTLERSDSSCAIDLLTALGCLSSCVDEFGMIRFASRSN